jgi:hypothetical protein
LIPSPKTGGKLRNSLANTDTIGAAEAIGKNLSTLPLIKPATRTAVRMLPIALHEWVTMGTWSVVAVIWDGPLFLHMGSYENRDYYANHWDKLLAIACSPAVPIGTSSIAVVIWDEQLLLQMGS